MKLSKFRHYIFYAEPTCAFSYDEKIFIINITEEPFLKDGGWYYRAIGSKDNKKNSKNVSNIDVSDKYIKMFCRRVSLKDAHKIHPNLFKYLDSLETS